MSLIDAYGLEGSPASLILIALSLDDRMENKIMGKMHIHKVISYFEEISKRKIFDFSNFHYGRVSYELQEDLDTLSENDLVITDEEDFSLTEEGERLANEFIERIDNEEIKLLEYSKQLLNDLPLDELMFFMYMKIPSSREHSSRFASLNSKREQLTISLFKKDRISAYTGAKWLGLSEREFLLLVKG